MGDRVALEDVEAIDGLGEKGLGLFQTLALLMLGDIDHVEGDWYGDGDFSECIEFKGLTIFGIP